MAVQQNKVSKKKIRQRKAANRYGGLQPGVCSMCGEPVMPHRVCAKCGHYRGRQVVSVNTD
ncbi:MAG: 50S ribosomal protein L32 [Lentisphaeria bacterium]|nr:50S ribosomal protein L32 [Lentisphaeria bacterium]